MSVAWQAQRPLPVGLPRLSEHCTSSQRNKITMDTDVARRIARLQYTAVRLPFILLEEGVVARYWDRDAAIRAGFERWLGSLDRPGRAAPGR